MYNGYFTGTTFLLIYVLYIKKQNIACCLCKFKTCQIIKRAEYEFTSLTIIPCHIILVNREFITAEKAKIKPLDSYKKLPVLTIIYFPREGWRAELDSAEAVPPAVTSVTITGLDFTFAEGRFVCLCYRPAGIVEGLRSQLLREAEILLFWLLHWCPSHPWPLYWEETEEGTLCLLHI